jgi:hypothetical protein
LTSTPNTTTCVALPPSRECGSLGHWGRGLGVALVLDALGHDGPARASRIPSAECVKHYADGIDPAEVDRESSDPYYFQHFGDAKLTKVEPPLKPYVSGWRREAWRP